APGGAPGDAILRGDEPGMARLHLPRELLREGPYLLLGRTAADRNVNVDALGPRRLREVGHAEAVQGLVHPSRGLPDSFEGRAGDRIEVEVEIVGPVHVVASRVPLVQVDASEVDDPAQ